MSDALPYRTEDIAAQAIGAAEAILHLHARDPESVARPAIRRSSGNFCRSSSRRPTP
jgi:uncharacterized protein (DUF849 family)